MGAAKWKVIRAGKWQGISCEPVAGFQVFPHRGGWYSWWGLVEAISHGRRTLFTVESDGCVRGKAAAEADMKRAKDADYRLYVYLR